MNRITLLLGLLALLALSPPPLAADEARAALFLVQRSFEATYAAYDGSEGAEGELLLVAEGPPGTTLLVAAFDGEGPLSGTAPMLAPQGDGTEPLRFPQESGAWKLDKDSPQADLYVAVFAKDDPQLPALAEGVERLQKALADGDSDAALLHATAIRTRLAAILRQRGDGKSDAEDTDSTTAASAPRRPPISIAGVMRKADDEASAPGAGSAVSALAAKSLERLDEEWREESQAVPVASGAPGILMFPVAPPSRP